MGAGTREADRLAEQQNEGPFLVLFDVGGGEFMSPTLADTLEDVQAHVEAAEKASDGNVTVRSIKLKKVLAANELVKALKDSRRRHHENQEDPWYSCPLSEGGCINDSVGEECNCGTDVYNARIDFALELAGEKV